MSNSFTATDFHESVMRTAQSDATPEDKLQNISISLFGEVGELANLTKKKLFHKHDFSDKKFLDELGDVLYYLVWLIDELTMQDILVSTQVRRVWDRKFVPSKSKVNFSNIAGSVAAIVSYTQNIETANRSLGALRQHILQILRQLDGLFMCLNVTGSFSVAAKLNQEKLQARYPEGYSHVASQQRSE